MAVQFRVLGGVEMRVDDRSVAVGHARQRCVLAALLVEADRAVSLDRLVDMAWGERIPQRTYGTLHSYLPRLRKTLATADVEIIRQSAGGYRLTADPETVDLHRFRRLTREARSADDEVAAQLYGDALALWEGEPFSGLDSPRLDAVRAELEQARFETELDRHDVQLRLGRHGQLLSTLAAAAVAHPLDERLAGQLMLACFRSGRQHEALGHYQQIRARLAEQLGADPSASLQQLHQQILRADQALAPPPAGVTTAVSRPEPASIPRQLPSAPHSITGRDRELASLEAISAAGRRSSAAVICTVSGTAGVGKTALALHWAHHIAARFPDGQLYVNLRGFDRQRVVTNPLEALRGFLDALGIPAHAIPADLDGQAALYRSVVADKRMLVVLDNARDAEQVRPLLPASPGCLVLVTSRARLAGLVATEGARPLTLDVLTASQARQLLEARIGSDRVRHEPEALDEIVGLCAGLPLALVIVAARAACHPQFTLAALAGELRDSRARLDALAGDDQATDVRSVLSWSYDALTPAPARMFRLLGRHPGPDVSAAAAASLAGVPLREARLLLNELVRAKPHHRTRSTEVPLPRPVARLRHRAGQSHRD